MEVLEVNKMPGTIAALPWGTNRSLFGGTRNEIKLSRPWQLPLSQIVQPDTCPFCTKPQKELLLPPGSPKGWKLLPNIYTPLMDHRLIISETCKPVEWLQRWGGCEALSQVFSIAASVITKAEQEITLLITVGYLAGQNLGHPHLHVFRSHAGMPMNFRALLSYAEADSVRIFSNELWIMAAGGARAGECLIVPTDVRDFASTTKSLAKIVSRIVDLGNVKFQSEEGLAPQYGIIVRIATDGTIRYASYSPTLHLWGPLQYVSSQLENEVLVLPWSHETTAAYLRQ